MITANTSLRQVLDAAAAAASTPAQALVVVDEALVDPQLVNAALLHHARARLLLQLGRVDDAIAAGERAVSLEPGVPDLATNLAAALLARARDGSRRADLVGSDLQSAERVLREAVVVGPQTAEVRSTLVVVLLQQSRCEEALQVADDNLAIFADDDVTRFNRAAVLQTLGQIDEARTALTALSTTFAPAKDALLRLSAPRR